MQAGNKSLFCSPRIKIPAYHQLFCRYSLVFPFRASTRVSVRRLFFQICAVWAGLSLGAVWTHATLAQRDRPDGQMWKNVAHQINIPRRSRGFCICGHSPSLPAPTNVALTTLSLAFPQHSIQSVIKRKRVFYSVSF